MLATELLTCTSNLRRSTAYCSSAGPQSDAEEGTTRCRPVRIAKRPQAYVWKGLIKREEARHIIEIAAPRMMRSRVGGGHTENEVVHVVGS